MKAGNCITCGNHAEIRNNLGHCNACYLLELAEYKARCTARKVAGVAYWQERGIKPGEKVVGTAYSFLGPFGPCEQRTGTAKVGKHGPYVSLPGSRRQLAPFQFHAIA